MACYRDNGQTQFFEGSELKDCIITTVTGFLIKLHIFVCPKPLVVLIVNAHTYSKPIIGVVQIVCVKHRNYTKSQLVLE